MGTLPRLSEADYGGANLALASLTNKRNDDYATLTGDELLHTVLTIGDTKYRHKPAGSR